jgi:hypothetical protein
MRTLSTRGRPDKPCGLHLLIEGKGPAVPRPGVWVHEQLHPRPAEERVRAAAVPVLERDRDRRLRLAVDAHGDAVSDAVRDLDRDRDGVSDVRDSTATSSATPYTRTSALHRLTTL